MSPCTTMMGSILAVALAIGSIPLALMFMNKMQSIFSRFKMPSMNILIPIPAVAILVLWTYSAVTAEPKPCSATAKSAVEFLD